MSGYSSRDAFYSRGAFLQARGYAAQFLPKMLVISHASASAAHALAWHLRDFKSLTDYFRYSTIQQTTTVNGVLRFCQSIGQSQF
ncbi:MAG: hypothetical protein AAFY22_03875 [Pseudomonadota bacterium]